MYEARNFSGCSLKPSQDIRKSLPQMLKSSAKVKTAVNTEVQRRIKERYPDAKKLKHQSADEWQPNCSFVNCYDGGQERYAAISSLTSLTV
jgi:hypothetical protein